MVENSLDFLIYFARASRERLSERENKIVDLRYGLTTDDALTLAAIGIELGVSRERIRQLLNKAHYKIISHGQRQIRALKVDDPCAELIIYVRSIVCPEKENSVDRLIKFTQTNLSHIPLITHALPLLTQLAYSDKQSVKNNLAIARKTVIKNYKLEKDLAKQEVKLFKLKNLLSYVIPPPQFNLIEVNDVQSFTRQRSISLCGEGNAGSFYSHKLNRLVLYESNLEKKFYYLLDSLDEIAFYQEQPLKIHYQIRDESLLYYPDILLVLKDGRGIVVEIKPIFKMGLKINLIKWSALKNYCNQNGLGLLVTDGRYAIQQIQKHSINLNFANALLSRLQAGSIGWSEYKEIKQSYSPSRNDFIAVVLNNKLVWKLSPFYLSY